ncbi:MAG: ribosomal RNA large subunit methyltransferase I [Burkholderiales bacterium]|nr:MAG: ribosomal RNA large subunit methyltransferase I [Burkholderiales bacterium]
MERTPTGRVIVKPGREKSLLRRHPWVFSGAIARVEANPGAGETVEIRSADGAFLGWGAFSPLSQIRVRIWSFDREEPIDAGFFRRRLSAALALRRDLVPAEETDALRLVHGESDGLPGVVADRYGDTLVLQLGSCGAEAWRECLAEQLVALTGTARVFERSDGEVRALEGLAPRVGPLRGGEPPVPVLIREHGLAYRVDVRRGHKTGFYLDQRVNRVRVARHASGRRVLNGFCYTGAFTVAALAAGAETVLSIDSSAPALEEARAHVALNGLDPSRCEWWDADMFQALRRLRDESRRFDLIVLDPPKFAPTAAQAPQAARGYKDLNWLAFRLLAPGGLLATFSCSGGVDEALFQKIVAGAALDAGVEACIVERYAAAPDHPVALNFPEGAYLKGLLCRIG